MCGELAQNLAPVIRQCQVAPVGNGFDALAEVIEALLAFGEL